MKGRRPKKTFFRGDFSQMWLDGVADSQTKSKTSPNHPAFLTQISPFVLPNLTKPFFWTPSLKSKAETCLRVFGLWWANWLWAGGRSGGQWRWGGGERSCQGQYLKRHFKGSVRLSGNTFQQLYVNKYISRRVSLIIGDTTLEIGLMVF